MLALAFMGPAHVPPTPPQILQDSHGAFRKASKAASKGDATRDGAKSTKTSQETMVFYEKPRPPNTRNTSLNPHGHASSTLAFQIGTRQAETMFCSRSWGGYRKPKTKGASCASAALACGLKAAESCKTLQIPCFL